MCSLVLVCAIFDDISARNRNNRIFPAVEICRSTDLRHFYLGDVGRSGVAVCVEVLVNNHASRETDVAVFITTIARVKHDLAVHHHEAERFTHALCRITGVPGQTTVHNTNNFAVHVLVNPVSLVKHCGRLIFRSIHFVICRNYINVRIVHVSFHNMNNLTIITRVVIQNDFGFGDTGCTVPVGLGDEVVVLICTCRSVVAVINTCCKCRERRICKNTGHHQKSKQE